MEKKIDGKIWGRCAIARSTERHRITMTWKCIYVKTGGTAPTHTSLHHTLFVKGKHAKTESRVFPFINKLFCKRTQITKQNSNMPFAVYIFRLESSPVTHQKQ